MLSALVGCGDGGEEFNEPTAPDEEVVDDPSASDSSDPADSDASDASDPDATDPDPADPDSTDPDPADPDPSETGEPNLEGTTCLPEPVREDGLELANLWLLFKSAREEACYLESYTENLADDAEWTAGDTPTPAETDWTCDDENRCRKYQGKLMLGWQIEVADFMWSLGTDLALGSLLVWQVEHDGETLWDVELEYIRNGSTASYRIERTYDSVGKIHFERSYFQTTLRHEITNTYEEGRLITQETVEQLGGGNSSTRVRMWNYNAEGQMVESSYQRLNGSLYETTFEYDAEGRVIGLERSQDGLRFLGQSWTFENGLLVSRNSSIEGQVWYEGADSYLPQIRDGYSSHWDDSGMRMGRGGCSQVPTSLWHGYPESDDVYILGWKRDDVPNRIGFGYGYDGFGFSYGDYSWMGHGGIATSYESSQMMEVTQVETTMTYDDKGRMVEETIDSGSDWGEEPPAARVTRTRVFEDDLMVEDSLTAQLNEGEMLNFESQVLSFGYDDTGKLIERTAQSDGVVNHQGTWTYDTEGRVNEHAIYGLSWNSQGTDEETLPLSGAFRDVYSIDGQTLERSREQKDLQTGEWFVDRTETVTQTEDGEIEQDNYFSSYLIRDMEGLLTEVGHGSASEPTMFLRIKRDSLNLVEESGRLDSSGMGAVFRRYTYQCSNR